jgi:hypothetical protein
MATCGSLTVTYSDVLIGALAHNLLTHATALLNLPSNENATKPWIACVGISHPAAFPFSAIRFAEYPTPVARGSRRCGGRDVRRTKRALCRRFIPSTSARPDWFAVAEQARRARSRHRARRGAVAARAPRPASLPRARARAEVKMHYLAVDARRAARGCSGATPSAPRRTPLRHRRDVRHFHGELLRAALG